MSANVTVAPEAASLEPAVASASVKQRWFALALLTLVNGLSMADRNIMLAAQESIKHEFRLTDSQVGMLSGMMFGVTYAIASIPMGVLADRWNRAKLLAIAQTVWSAATGLVSLAQGFATLLVLRFTVGLTEATCVPASLALIADYFPPKQRSSAFSLFYLGVPIGASTSLALGGPIIAHWGWRLGFVVAGLPGLLVAATIFFTLRRPPRAADADGAVPVSRSSVLSAVKTALSLPAQRYLLGGIVLISACASGVVNWAVPFLMRVHHLPLSQASVIMGVTMGLGLAGLGGAGLLFHKIRDKDPRYGLFYAAGVALITAAASALFLLSPSVWGSVAGLAVVGFLGYSYAGPIWATALNLAHEHERGTMAAVLQVLTTFLGYGAGTWIVGRLSDAYGGPQSLRWAMLTIVSLYLMAAVLFARVAAHIRQDLTTIAAGPSI